MEQVEAEVKNTCHRSRVKHEVHLQVIKALRGLMNWLALACKHTHMRVFQAVRCTIHLNGGVNVLVSQDLRPIIFLMGLTFYYADLQRSSPCPQQQQQQCVRCTSGGSAIDS